MKNSYFLFLLAIVFASCSHHNKSQVSNLTVEYLTNPLGVDVEQPRFSWKISSEERGVKQTAWQVIVGESLDDVKKEKGPVWDSGRISGDKTANVEFAGKLKSNTTYFWRVRTWLDEENAVWSTPATFHTGILDEKEWQAQWISTQEEIVDASPLLRKQFQLEKKVEQAYAYVTAAGFYEFYLNGEKVGDHVLDPGVTDYRETILYSTYNVTDLLKKGSNAAGAILGNTAWNFQKTKNQWN